MSCESKTQNPRPPSHQINFPDVPEALRTMIMIPRPVSSPAVQPDPPYITPEDLYVPYISLSLNSNVPLATKIGAPDS